MRDRKTANLRAIIGHVRPSRERILHVSVHSCVAGDDGFKDDPEQRPPGREGETGPPGTRREAPDNPDKTTRTQTRRARNDNKKQTASAVRNEVALAEDC